MSEKIDSECLARIVKLETVIDERFKQMETHFKQMESYLGQMQSSLTAKLDRLDEDIRGNGKDGINVRLDRLENSKKLASRWFWAVVSARIPVLIGTYLSWLGLN